MDNLPISRKQIARGWLQRGITTLRRFLPFTLGVLATLLALLAYNLITPHTPQLTQRDVNQAVGQALASATPAPAFSETVYRIIQPSLVLIEGVGTGQDGQEGDSLGSGVIVDQNADILTCLHVITNTTSITVTFADGTQSSAKMIASDPSIDIAVLQPDQLPSLIVPAVLGNPNSLRVGDEAYAVGNPFGLYSSMSAGVISGFDRTFEPEGSRLALRGMIQFDAAVNPGNSGGPLLNRQGQVVGIVTGIANPTEQNFFIGIGFAVPITVAGAAAGEPNY